MVAATLLDSGNVDVNSAQTVQTVHTVHTGSEAPGAVEGGGADLAAHLDVETKLEVWLRWHMCNNNQSIYAGVLDSFSKEDTEVTLFSFIGHDSSDISHELSIIAHVRRDILSLFFCLCCV